MTSLLNPSTQSLYHEALPLCFYENPWFLAVVLCLANASLLPHCSRQKFIGFKVALDDDGTAEGCLFWDDGQSIGE